MTDYSENEARESLDYDLGVFLRDGVVNHFVPHRLLFDQLKLDRKDVVLVNIYRILAALCDPITQPEDSDALPLSVDLLARVAIALCYDIALQGRREENARPARANGEPAPVDVGTIRFLISTKFHLILLAITRAINADDELRVRYLQNNWRDWQSTVQHWIPSLYNMDHLKLAYYMCSVALMVLYRLFLPPDESHYNAALNPYLETFLRLWKTHTNIVALALEMDRALEEELWSDRDPVETPYIVKRVLLGSSAIRTVLTWILERTSAPDGELLVSAPLDLDVRLKTLLSFYDPLARSAANCGSLSHDQHMLMAAVLLLRCRSAYSPCWRDAAYLDNIPFPGFDFEDLVHRVDRRLDPLQATGDLMVDMYYEDQFDEDIKYVFGYYDSDDNDSDKASDEDALGNRGIALRATGNEREFDDQGRDWRDCPRGDNVHFTERFLALELLLRSSNDESTYFCISWPDMLGCLLFLFTSIDTMPELMTNFGQVAIDSIAKAVKDENTRTESKIVVKEIYRYLVSPVDSDRSQLFVLGAPLHPVTNFEVILIANPHCAFAMLDELFMCNGLRRSLVWFLTNHVNPQISLIGYLYELVAGLRGDSPDREQKYMFLRVGALEISLMERLMILHELFAAADKWLANDDASTALSKLKCVRIVKYICLMIKKLILDGIIRSSPDDTYENYSHEIQLLLFNWIGRVPETRDIFFRINLLEPTRTEERGLEDAGARKGGLAETGTSKATEKEEVKETGKIKDAAKTKVTGKAKEGKMNEKDKLIDTSGEALDTSKARPSGISTNAKARKDRVEIIATIKKFFEEVKAGNKLDAVTYVMKSIEPRCHDAFVDFADLIADYVYDIYKKRDYVTSGENSYEFEDIQLFLTHFNELYRNQIFVDQLVGRPAGWILDTRGKKVNFVERGGDFELETFGAVEPEVVLEAVDCEFSDAFLDAEEPYLSTEKPAKSSKKKSKKKRRGKK